ncbi:hypothetical protein BDQ12DRAFT_231853 [Crucibulum laeve]|uniref:Uncharacterized protein n=1 Tax=Crucibulum laeve TaxID=68775 RepID=A0A5C3LVX2_9AGAR|nr:hypothetical protein BDQ12DRAFT_231853 [Crucibulum laeve]
MRCTSQSSLRFKHDASLDVLKIVLNICAVVLLFQIAHLNSHTDSLGSWIGSRVNFESRPIPNAFTHTHTPVFFHQEKEIKEPSEQFRREIISAIRRQLLIR